MGKRQGVTYRDLKKNKTNKKKQEEPKREQKKAVKKVDRKSTAPQNERAGAANRAGAKENLYNAGSSIKSAYKNNLAESQKNKSKVASSSWGQVASKAADTQKNRAQARKAFKKNTTGKGAQTAYKTGEKARENYQKAGEKTVHTKSPLTIQTQTAAEGVRNLTQQVSQANKFYDKNEKKAQKEGMTYGDKKEFIRRWATDPSNKEYLDNYKKYLKEDSTYKYTKSGKDTDTFFQEAVASNPAFAYQKVKTETDVPVYLRDKEGNIKYDKDGKPRVKTDKNGDTVYQKVDTTLGNNILNAKAGGFDKNGRLTSMEGSEQMGNQTAGALRDAKFFGGLLQGTSYGDITKGLGTYSNAAARDLDKTTQSGAFNAGYGIGIMAQFGLSGINSMGKALLKEGMKSVPKTIAKTAGLSAALDTPLNIADAVKMGTDARGNINPSAVAMYMGINTLMSGLMPAGIEGLGAGVTHAQSKELLNLLAREEKLVQAGKTLSPQDAMRRDELFAKQAKTAEGQVSAAGVIAGKTLDDIAGKGGNPTVNAIRAKVQVDPKKALGKVSEDNPTTDDLITIGAVKDISRKRGDFKTAAEAELKLRKMRDGLDPEMKKQVDAMMKQVDSTRKIEAANIFKEADAKEIVSRADEGKSVTSRVLTELEGAVEYARQTGDSKLLSDAETALQQAKAENKKLIEGITNTYKGLSEKLNIPIKANTKAELDKVLKANGTEVPNGNYGGFVLRDANGRVKEIYVNADAPEAVSFTIGHEITHVMEAAGEDYTALRDMLKEYDGGRLWNEESSKIVDLYTGVKNADMEREATANTLGRILVAEGDEFLESMAKKNPSLLSKIYNFLKRVLKNEKNEELDAIKTKVGKILDEYADDTTRKDEFMDYDADFMMIGTSAQEGVAGIRKTNTSTGKITKETIKLSYDALDNPRTGAKAVLKRRIESAIKAGASREELARIHDEVRRKTGWVMGADGNWEFEINDSPARFGFKLTPRGKAFVEDTEVPKIAALETEILDPNTSPRRRSQLLKQKEDLDRAWGTHGLYTEEGAPLNEFLVHPELFKAYKDFKKSKVRMRFDVGDIKISRDSNGEINGLACTAGKSGSYFGQHHKGNLSLNATILKVPKGETMEDYARALRFEAARRYGMEIPRPEDFEGMSKKELLEICDERGIELKGKVKRNGKTITLNRKTATEADLINRLAVKDEDVPQEFLRGTTLHEIQHRIQAKEGWAGGGMQATWQKKQRLYDDKGNVVKEYYTNDLTIAKNPKDQKLLDKNRAAMKQSLAKYGDLAIDEESAVDSSTLQYIEYTIGKEFPEQVRKLLDSNNADEYVNLMMDEMPSVSMREMLIPFDGVFPPETQALDTAMRKYFKDSFEARRYAASSDDVYSGLIGEQQSRMTQRRSRMTPKERAETPVLDADATYRYGDIEAQGQPVPIDNALYQSTFNRKYSNTRVDESGNIDFGRVWKDPNEKKEASFSILDTSDKLKAQKETRAKEQADIIKRVRETIAKEAKEASQYGKDTTKHPVKEKAIMDAFNKAYDERTGVVKWGEVYKALAEDPNFNPKMAKSIRNRLKRAFEGETVTTTKVKKTVESPDEFKADVEETRVPENEMSDEEFFRGLEAPEEEPPVEANWNEAVPAKATKTNEKLLAKEDVASIKSLVDELETAQKKLPKATTAEKRMAIEKEISSLDAKINSEIESIGDKELEKYYNLRKSLGNASTDEERAALKEEIARIEQGEVAEPPKPAKPKPAEKPAKPKPTEKPAKPEAKPEKPPKEKTEKAQATLDKQMEYYAEAEDALAKATTPEEIKLAKQRLGLAKGRVQKASNAIDVLNGTKPAKVKADVTPLPKGESLPEPPAGRAQELKEEMPNLETILKNAKEGWISKHELGEHAKHLGEYWSEEAKATDAAFKNAVKNKELGGKVGRDIPYNEAFKKASEDVEKDLGKVYDRVMSRDNFIVETTQSAADKHALLMKLVEKAGEGGENAETYAMMHLKVIDKMDEAASLGGHMLQLQSYILRNSPEGRVRWVAREIARLSKEYQKHLKGKQIEISPEQIKKILEAKSEKAVAEVMEDTGKMIWKQIPAGFFESANQIRHFSMLFNPKTHARNIVGNSVFLGARTISDVIEVGMTKLFNRRLQNLSPIDQYEAVLKDLREQQKGATPKQKQELGYKIRETNKLLAEAKADANSPMRQYLASGEVSGCKKILDERFDLDYKTNGGQSTGKFQEGRRSAGYIYEQSGNKLRDTIAKGTNKMIDLNYWLLDQEDKLYFRPAYERAYIRWCKSRGLVEKVGNTDMVTPKVLEKMSKTDLQEATAYAMQQAKIATFRDDSAISDRIIQWKRATEGKKGTGLGTVGYRTLNVGLESVLPFVKTPVNILRRGMDYSPIGMFRGLADSVLAKDPQTFMRGIHEMSAGLTGTGIAMLGMWAASHDWVMVHAGEVSGDEYYDRDMGYQDFSLTVFGKSYSLDWMAPVQLAFFQGAAVYKDLCERKGISMETALNALEAGVMPMLEMSFLSSAKDTVTSFMERAYRDGTGNEANAAQAIGRTLFGTLPQDWLSGFVPQLLSQTAGFTDDYQRDTSSTKEDELARSWESFGRKMQNRLPHFRESLQPKVNRRGEEVKVEGSDNIMAKIFNSFANPANVKKITLDKYDRAVIDVLGDEELDEDKKKYIPLDLTGNPSYDRGEDFARMTYTEKHDYLVSKRADQWQNWKSAVDSKSFKDMTTKMKADELTDYHFLGQIKADKDVYGIKYAAKKIVEKGSKEADLWKNIKYFGGNAKDFVDSYVAIEKLSARSHKNDYHTKALAIRAMDTSEKKKDLIGKAYDIYGDKLEPAKTFLSKYKDATKALADYTDAFCSGESVCEKAGVSDSKKNMSLALANVEGGVPEKVYRAGGYDWNSAQAGGGLKKYGYTYDSLAQMKSDALMKADTDNNNSLKKAEVIDYIESLGIEDNDEKACLFEYLKSGSAKNPYGTIKDHLEWNSTPDTTGSGGGRRGYGRRRGRGGGSGGGGRGIGWEAWLKKQGLAQASKAGGNSRRTSDNTSKSALDEAYRKKLSQNIRATSKKH